MKPGRLARPDPMFLYRWWWARRTPPPVSAGQLTLETALRLTPWPAPDELRRPREAWLRDEVAAALVRAHNTTKG